MANSYHQMYIQAVFAVKYRNALIAEKWKKDLFAVIVQCPLNDNGIKVLYLAKI